MATRQRNTNPFMSANLGSGARTTTGGTYENPRLGIQDYSAFGKGVASTFRIPKQEEKAPELQLPTIDYIGAQKDTMLGDNQWMENSNLVNQLTSDLQPLKTQFAKCTKANDQQCLKNIGATLNVIQTGQAQFQNMLTKYADSEIMDSETSKGQYMIGTDKKNIRRPDGSFLSLADITKVNNESPKNITVGVVDGKAVYKVKLDGTSYNVNLSDLTENYLTNSFDIRSDIGLDVQTAMRSGGFTSNWEDKPTMYSSQTSETTEDGVSIKTLKGYEGIVSGIGYFENANSKSKTFSNNLYKTISSPNVNSAFHKLTAKIYDGFNSVDEYNSDILAIKSRSKDLNSFRTQMAQIPNDIKLKILQDEAEQEWLIANASNGHRRGEDGRAERLDKNYLVKTSRVEKPIDEDDDSGYGFSVDNMLNTIELAFGEGRMTGVDAAPGVFKSREMNIPTVVKYLQNHAPQGVNFFNINDNQAAKNILGSRKDLTEQQRQQFENIIMQKAPGKDAARLVGYLDKSGNIQVTNFNGTVGSLLNTVSSFQPKLNTKQLRQAINDKFGVDIEEFSEPDRLKKETQIDPSADPSILSN